MVSLESGTIIFNPVSWETHFVDSAVGGIVEALLGGAATPEQVRDACFGTLDDSAEREAADRFVDEALQQLAELELVVSSAHSAHR